MESLHGEAGGHGQPRIRVPALVQRAGGEYRPGAGEVLKESLPGPTGGGARYFHAYSHSPSPVIDITSQLTTGPGNHYFAHLLPIIMHTCSPSLCTPGLHHLDYRPFI